MRGNGGNRYNRRFFQGKDKASTLHTARSSSGDMYVGSWVVSDVAKWSTCGWPHRHQV